MKRLGVLMLLFFVLAGCGGLSTSVTTAIDAKSFRLFGGTFFSSAEEVSIKQLLLDTADLMTRQIIVEGEILDVGEHFTYLVIHDESAKLLVVLTEMDSNALRTKKTQRVKILGKVESGGKGLPFVKARSIREL